jgi:PKD repeat protein
MHLGMKRILVITLAALACSKGGLPARDAGIESPLPDTAVPSNDVPVALSVDFSVENCPAFDAQALTCTGKAPLTVRFVPLATTTVTQYFWNFGDASPFDSQLAPSHVYTTPGSYSVEVVASGVGGGVVTKTHAGFIVVETNAIGDPCDTDTQCDQGLFCLCPTSAPCSTGPAHGMCASSCPAGQAGICGDNQVCAGLDTATPPAGMASAWQAPTCLRECAKDADCAAGLGCRTLPPGPAGSAWLHGCFTSVPYDVGEPCRDSAGNLRDDLCASGLCADLGANGMCSASCARASCPPGSDCAVLGDGRKLCLRPCTNFACSQDPLLVCVIPTAGDIGYQLATPNSPNAASSYCAPRPCKSDSTTDPCLPAGTCVYNLGGSHCVRRSN